jgi:hypothetical protein
MPTKETRPLAGRRRPVEVVSGAGSPDLVLVVVPQLVHELLEAADQRLGLARAEVGEHDGDHTGLAVAAAHERPPGLRPPDRSIAPLGRPLDATEGAPPV